jgi:protease II
MTLVFNKNILLNRSNPCLLHGYGAYGINLDAEFNIVYLSALE